jgi:RND family efflux transporter MFP subunit
VRAFFSNRFTRITAAQIAFLVTAALAVRAWWVHSVLLISPSSQEKTAPATALSVELTNPVIENWPQQILASGVLSPWQEAVVSSETGNLRVNEVLVDVGSTVKRGQLMARLADASVQADLRKQDAAVEQAKLNLTQARNNLQRTLAAAGSGALSNQKSDEYVIDEGLKRAALASAEAEQQSMRIKLEQTRIVAMDDGIVSSRSAVLGNVVAAGTELFRLIRQGRVEWRAELDAQQLARIKTGQSARLVLPGGQRINGTVRLVAPTLSTSTGRALVYVTLPTGSESGGAQSGMFASGTIELVQTPALTLPQSAIVLRDGRSDVYVLAEDGSNKVSRRTVVTGRRVGDRVELLSGLDASARVVASGGAFLSEGARVQVTNAGQSKEKTSKGAGA